MRKIKRVTVSVLSTLVILSPLPILANGVGEGRSFQFRSDSQRQVLIAMERTRLEMLGLLGSSGGGGTGGGSGQTGNAASINVSGSNNTITVTQTNSGAQTQTSSCSDFNITGGMYGVC